MKYTEISSPKFFTGIPGDGPAGEYPAYLAWILVPSFFFAVGSAVLLVVAGLTRTQPISTESESLVWNRPWEALQGEAWRGLGDYRVLAGVLFVTMVALYWVFR